MYSFSEECLARLDKVHYVRLKKDIRRSAGDYYDEFKGMPLLIISEPDNHPGRENHLTLCLYPYLYNRSTRIHDSVYRFMEYHRAFGYRNYMNVDIASHAVSFKVFVRYGKGVGTVAIPRNLLEDMSSNALNKHSLERL